MDILVDFINRFSKLDTTNQQKVINYAQNLLDFQSNKTHGDANYPYLKNLTKNSSDFVLQILNEYQMNLWISINSFLEYRKLERLEDAFLGYQEIYKKERPYVLSQRDELWELFKEIKALKQKKAKKA